MMWSERRNRTNIIAVVMCGLCCLVNLRNVVTSPTGNATDYLQLFKYDRPWKVTNDQTAVIPESTTLSTLMSTVVNGWNGALSQQVTNNNKHHQTESDLYTLQLGSQHNQRQHKQDDQMVYDYKCPKQHYIHPCDCLELDKRMEMLEGSGDIPELAINATPTVEVVEEDSLNPELVETVAFCKNIRNVQVLTEAIRGFQGHRVNYFVLDGCKLPSFPNNLFRGIHVVWMEVLNSTMQFHDNFFHSKSCP